MLVGLLIGLKAGWVDSSWAAGWLDYVIWVFAAGFALRAIGEFKYVGFFKSVKGPGFAWYDTRIYSPLCVLLCLICVRLVCC